MKVLEAFQAGLQQRLGRKVTVVLADQASLVIIRAEGLGHCTTTLEDFAATPDLTTLLEQAAFIFERRKQP